MPSHTEKKTLPYSAAQLFALVADVEKYPEFLPWCLDLNITERRADGFSADMTIGYMFFRESFTSNVKLQPDTRIDVAYEHGPFKYLHNAWNFKDVAGGCEIDFAIDFEFNQTGLSAMIEPVFFDAVQRMVSAFESRAAVIYSK